MTATETIALAPPGPHNGHWQSRIQTAEKLIADGHGDAVYDTQFASGTCAWTLPDGSRVTISPEYARKV